MFILQKEKGGKMRSVFSIFLLAAAWQDLKSRRIQIWLYICFGAIGLCVSLFPWIGQGNASPGSFVWAASAVIPGLLLLLISRVSRGGVGMGDGWFFVAAAFYLGLWKTLALLFYGLFFCSICSLGMITWGMVRGIGVRKRKLPFLPFLVPAWFLIAWW